MKDMIDDRSQEIADDRLTKTQRDIRDRNSKLPRHIRRSIDRFRVARGMVPLWDSSLERRSRS